VSDFFSYGGKPEAAGERGEAPLAILADLSGDEWEKLIGFAARRSYPAGAVVVHAGAAARALCFIASGEVEIRGPGPVRDVRGEGEVFGLLSFLDGAASEITATVTPAAAAELLLLTPEALQQLAAWQPRIALALLRDLGAHVATRLRRLQPGD
jgi:CRP-like cAMP-binding protein